MLKIFIFIYLCAFSLNASSTMLLEKKGAKIASVMCDKEKLHTINFTTIEDAQKKIITQNLCSNLTKKQLLAVATFLSNKQTKTKAPQKITVPKDAKCPICGMFVAKFPKWVATLKTSKNKTLYFDGVKDMMKYYFNHPKEKFSDIFVHDFYTLTPISAKEAFFVIGSNVYGPMGEELIPFSKEEDAKTFFQEHKGKKIIKFDEILEDYLY